VVPKQPHGIKMAGQWRHIPP